MTALSTFVPAGTVALTVPYNTAMTLAMPSVDGSNLDTVVANTGGSIVWLVFAGSVPLTSNAPGSVAVQPGQTLLLSTNATTLSLMGANPAVQGGAQALAAQTAAALTAFAPMGTTLTITRGTATARQVWVA